MQATSPSWSVAIFSSRESISTLSACIRAVLHASHQRTVGVEVLVNGNQALAKEAVGLLASMHPMSHGSFVRIWHIPFGDKAHAWNEYIHQIWPSSEIAYFVDGYVEVKPDAFLLIEKCLDNAPDALGATGVPTSGRSANKLRNAMLKTGGIHGNLHAIRGSVVSAMKKNKFRLPLGIYRTDSLIGAVMCYKLDPSEYQWDSHRVVVHPDATWLVRPTQWWRPRNAIAHLKRTLRQNQGVLENLAVREHLAIGRHAPESLPATVNELVIDWMDGHKQQVSQIFRQRPLTAYAARKLRVPRDWSGAGLTPIQLGMKSTQTT